MNLRRLQLPSVTPDGAPLDSIKWNKVSEYNPIFWELNYHAGRYLRDTPVDELKNRYNSILRNIRSLVSDEGAVKPITWIDSSWYWFKKEHQTRLEFEIRSEMLPCEPPWNIHFNKTYHDAPLRPKHFNSGDVLFRYHKFNYLNQLLRDGRLRLVQASSYACIENDEARQDVETSKDTLHGSSSVRITTESGEEVPVIGVLRKTVSLPNYYLLSLSGDWDRNLFDDFQADTCLVVRDANSFIERVKLSTQIQLPGWECFFVPVHYYDPCNHSSNHPIDPAMSKDFRFAYQREFRLIWLPSATVELKPFLFIEIGNIEDIAFLCSK